MSEMLIDPGQMMRRMALRVTLRVAQFGLLWTWATADHALSWIEGRLRKERP